MNYEAAIAYLLTFADFERSGRFAERPDLAPMVDLLSRMSDPHLGRPTVHIAGSKGKGSTAAMVESILRAAGHRTGLFTSPHLHSYCERIRIDGQPIAEAEFARLAQALETAVEAVNSRADGRRLITFDLLTAMGFLAFRGHEVDVQVVEVGLGGRLDSTNVFQAPDVQATQVCVITPLSLEHTAILGDTVEAIAAEKAGIIRPGSRIVLAPQGYPEATAVVRAAAQRAGASLLEVDRAYSWQQLKAGLEGQRFTLQRPDGPPLEMTLPLLGQHQLENATTAIAAASALAMPLPDNAIVEGLRTVEWPGRLEVLRKHPVVLADGAHNRDSARRLCQTLAELVPGREVIYIAGTSADKDIGGIAAELAPSASSVIATRSSHPRSLPAEEVAAAFAVAGCSVDMAETVGEAIDRALALASAETVICLVGSLFLVAEGREYLGLGDPV